MKNNILISPSVLAADFSKLGDEVQSVSEMGADFIHLDIMDGHFVPNLSFGADIVRVIRPYSNLPFDVHLMITNPEIYISSYVDAGANLITVHPESTSHIHSVLQQIKKSGIKAGVALNPGTPLEVLDNIIDVTDLVLVMTVNPGFGGQSFLLSQLAKISKIRSIIDKENYSIDLSVDGGINAKTAALAIDAGANVLVAGTSIFKSKDKTYLESINQLRNIVP